MQSAKRRTIYTLDARIALAPPIEGRPVTLSGYAIVWNVLSVDRGGYKVRLLPGSATFATPTHAIFHHDFSQVLGSTANNTLRITPDGYGVKVEIDLPNTTHGRDTAELVRRGDVNGMSFAMVDDPEATETTENGIVIVNAKSFVVDEVTVTAIPAFPQAKVDVRQPLNPPASYAARNSQSLQLERLNLDMIGQPGQRSRTAV
jgi:HK97 family phage prohead protease